MSPWPPVQVPEVYSMSPINAICWDGIEDADDVAEYDDEGDGDDDEDDVADDVAVEEEEDDDVDDDVLVEEDVADIVGPGVTSQTNGISFWQDWSLSKPANIA